MVSLTLAAGLLLSNSSAGGLDGLGHRNLGRFLVPPDGHTELGRASPPLIFWWDDPLVSGISEVSHRDCVITQVLVSLRDGSYAGAYAHNGAYCQAARTRLLLPSTG